LGRELIEDDIANTFKKSLGLESHAMEMSGHPLQSKLCKSGGRVAGIGMRVKEWVERYRCTSTYDAVRRARALARVLLVEMVTGAAEAILRAFVAELDDPEESASLRVKSIDGESGSAPASEAFFRGRPLRLNTGFTLGGVVGGDAGTFDMYCIGNEDMVL
jgi:hypothetical protein